MEEAATALEKVLNSLDPQLSQRPSSPPHSSDLPTLKQGQFIAYIREYMSRSYARVAPTHAALQRFFKLTPSSVNSMLVRLEQRGFTRRIPGKARSIELTIDPVAIPELERPFKM